MKFSNGILQCFLSVTGKIIIKIEKSADITERDFLVPLQILCAQKIAETFSEQSSSSAQKFAQWLEGSQYVPCSLALITRPFENNKWIEETACPFLLDIAWANDGNVFHV